MIEKYWPKNPIPPSVLQSSCLGLEEFTHFLKSTVTVIWRYATPEKKWLWHMVLADWFALGSVQCVNAPHFDYRDFFRIIEVYSL